MEEILIRIESKKNERHRKWLRVLMVLFVIAFSFSVYKSYSLEDVGIGKWIDFLIQMMVGLFIFWVYNKLEKRLGQFIEWDVNEVKFKLRDSDKLIKIKNADIKEILYYGDIIDIKTKDDNLFKLNTEDLGEFRLRIRENFDRIKRTVPNKYGFV